MELPDYVQSVSFRLARPDLPGSKAICLAAGLLRRMGVPLDEWNTRLPGEDRSMRRRLRAARHACRTGRFAVGAIINRAVSRLAPGEAFVALGVGDGFPLLAAISGNPDKPCIGVDPCDAIECGHDQRPQFLRTFESLRTAEQRLHRLSFGDYFTQLHEGPIGCCLIGQSAAADPLELLNTAEPHLVENAVVLVENVNDAAHESAVLTFIGSSANQYRILLDQRTVHHGELTFGTGLLVFQLLGRNAAAKRPLEKPITPVLVPAA
jgi:hypothetical protein